MPSTRSVGVLLIQYSMSSASASSTLVTSIFVRSIRSSIMLESQGFCQFGPAWLPYAARPLV